MRTVFATALVAAMCTPSCTCGAPPGEGEGEGEVPCESQPGVPGLSARPSNTTCVAPARPHQGGAVTLLEPWPNLEVVSPLLLLQEPGTTRMYAVERAGRIVRFDKDDATVTTPEVFADITDRVETSDTIGDERGLLGMAFHPDWPVVEEVFVAYVASGGSPYLDRVSRFTLDGGGLVDEASEEILLNIDDFATNHNGGMIAFGRDGMLYVGTGDGGGANDPWDNGQTTQTLLGKMLRIDVDTVTSPLPYGLPADNPFLADPGYAPEIYAVGLRNPWRWSFDRATGDLWVGDVGQSELEEVDVIAAGGNYGWNTYEGTDCYDDTDGACAHGGFSPPVLQYRHTAGRTAIIGGYVYDGSAIPELRGTYVFGDGSSAEIFQLLFDDQGRARDVDDPGVTLIGSGEYISAFSEDADGELYVLRVETNRIERLVPAGPPAPTAFPQTLSATGCVDATDARSPARGMIPYDVNHALWSDGATKERYLALPDAATIDVAADGDMILPIGAVVMKHLLVDDAYVETRLLVRHDDGNWAGYSFEWNDEQTDAALLPPVGKQKVLGNGQTWLYPSRNGCLACHTDAAGRTLGLELQQQNRVIAYEQGACANQLTTWDAIGVFTAALPGAAETLPALPAVDDATASTEARARALLHVNCSSCHRPNGGGGGLADLRAATSLAEAHLCDEAPAHGDLSIPDARLIAPGEPARSLVSVRMQRSGATRMPKLGSLVVDSGGVAVVNAFIEELTSCP